MKFVAWINFPGMTGNREITPSQAIKDAVQEAGGKIELLGFPQSRYDAIALYDCPDIAASTIAKVRLQQQGYHVETSTFLDSSELDRAWKQAAKLEHAH